MDIADSVERFRRFFAFFANEPDRSAAILVPAKFDAQLLLCLQKFLLPASSPKNDLILGSNGALATFSARIEMCYRLGIVDDGFARALHLLRKIRNDFAHGFEEEDFTAPRHKSRIKELVAPIVDSDYFHAAMSIVKPTNGDERSRYLVISGMMTGLLELYPNVVHQLGSSSTPTLSFTVDMG